MILSKTTERTVLQLDDYTIPWLQYGDQQISPIMHFSPANGIPAASYDSFFKKLEHRFAISAMDSRGAWENIKSPDESLTFHDYADDLINALQLNYNIPVIGVGHSLGGFITILAAIKRPELFSQIVLIDPASTPTRLANYIFQLLPKSLHLKFFSFIRGSLERRSIWDSREQFFNNYRDHKTFERFTDQALIDYAHHGLRKRSDGQYELIFSPEWESFNFRKVGFLWDQLSALSHPILFLRAEHGSLYNDATFTKYNRRLSDNVTAITLKNTSHLMTHEQTDVVSTAVLEWL